MKMRWLVAAAASAAMWMASGCGSSDQVAVTQVDGGAEAGVEDDAVDLVQRCEEVVDESCRVLSGCCHEDTVFDTFECRRTQLDACFSLLGLEQTGSNLAVYDRAAADACLRPLRECPDDYTAQDPYYDPYYGGNSYGTSFFVDPTDQAQMIACSRVQSGRRPLGSACYESSQCEASGTNGYPECFRSPQRGEGVCAKAVFSTDGTCGFDPDTLLHKLCGLDEYCETGDGQTGGRPYGPYPPYGYDPYGPNNDQGSSSFAFEGECISLRTEGQSCYDSATGENFPCAEGLVCSYEYNNEVCERPLSEGEPCNSSNVGCEFGLYCDYGLNQCVVDRNPAFDGSSGGPFCYVNSEDQPQPVCGDGVCESPREDSYSCPPDCNVCGDYRCTGDEPSYCPEDCGYYEPYPPYGYVCGDGFCDAGEEAYCVQDCGTPSCIAFTTCLAAQPDQPACAAEGTCVCNYCSCQYSDCNLTTGCLTIAACMEAAGCSDVTSCYTTANCRSVIDANGGQFGTAVFAAQDLMGCRADSSCQACTTPPVVDAGAPGVDSGTTPAVDSGTSAADAGTDGG